MVSKAAKTDDETKRKEAWYELLRIASTDANATPYSLHGWTLMHLPPIWPASNVAHLLESHRSERILVG